MWACCHFDWLWIQDAVVAAFLVILQWILKSVFVVVNKKKRDWGVSELSVKSEAQHPHVAVWCPLVAIAQRSSCCRGKHKSHTRRLLFTHYDTQELTPRNIQKSQHNMWTTPLKEAEPWSITLLLLIKIFSCDTQRKWRHSPVNQSINSYEICICLNMEFDSIKPISRTISLCKHLRDSKGERVAECSWGLFKEHTTENGSVCVGHIIGFNWIVLHQCQGVTWYVCRGLYSFWLRAWFSLSLSVSFFLSPPKQGNTWQGKKVLLRFQSQTISEKGTQRGSRHIKVDWKHFSASRPCS